MYDGHPHPLLAQVPLTVSPFLALPAATTLPYTYKQLPSTLPPSSTANPSAAEYNLSSTAQSEKPAYVLSKSGHAAHPDDIIASCTALQAHLVKMEHDSRAALENWEKEMSDRDLAEKRRVAPGWLDSDERMLVPTKKDESNKP